MALSHQANVRDLLAARRRQSAVVVSSRRSVRKALALALADAGFEVLSLESEKAMPWLETVRPGKEFDGEYVVVDGEVARALAVVDVLRAQGISCPVRILAGASFDGPAGADGRSVA